MLLLLLVALLRKPFFRLWLFDTDAREREERERVAESRHPPDVIQIIDSLLCVRLRTRGPQLWLQRPV